MNDKPKLDCSLKCLKYLGPHICVSLFHCGDIICDFLYVAFTPVCNNHIRYAMIAFIIIPFAIILIMSILVSIYAPKKKNKFKNFLRIFFGLYLNFPPLFTVEEDDEKSDNLWFFGLLFAYTEDIFQIIL